MSFYNLQKYIEYLIYSGHRKGHGVHSPFIFDLVSNQFRNKTPGSVVLSIEKIRKRLEADRRFININDLGAGQTINKTIRKVSEKARYSSVPRKYGNLLYNLAAQFGDTQIIELGTSFGFSAMYMASADPYRTVYTIEGCGECAAIAGDNFREAGLSNIVQLVGSFDSVLPELSDKGIRPGLVFIDGNHRKEPVLKYFSILSGMSDENTVMVLDDIYYSAEMTEAWNEIRSQENVSASIDVFRMGIIFFKSNITRNHYIIRY